MKEKSSYTPVEVTKIVAEAIKNISKSKTSVTSMEPKDITKRVQDAIKKDIKPTVLKVSTIKCGTKRVISITSDNVFDKTTLDIIEKAIGCGTPKLIFLQPLAGKPEFIINLEVSDP